MSARYSGYVVGYLPSDGQPSSIQLDDSLTIGSGSDVNIQLASHAVSPQHARIFLRGEQVYIIDLDSKTGTYLNGQRLYPNQEYEWLPGDILNVPDAKFELSQTYLAPTAAPGSQGEFHLRVSSNKVKPLQNIQLTLQYQGQVEQYVTFKANSLAPGLVVSLRPNGGTIQPQGRLESSAQVKKTKPLWRGGNFRIRFAANTVSGLVDTAEVIVRVRPRYELLLLLLLIPLPFLFLRGNNGINIAQLPTSTINTMTATTSATATTEQPTSTATSTPQPSNTAMEVTVTSPPPATSLPVTIAPDTLPPPCNNQCAAYGWPNYTIQSGDTLYSLSQKSNTGMSLIQQVNCLSDPNQLIAGNNICLPIPPTIPPPTCAGFRLTSPASFPQGAVDFYWDAPSEFTPTSYRLEVFNEENNALLTSRDVTGATTTRLDVGWNAVGRYLKAIWRVQALVNGTALCSDELVVPIQFPPTEPPPPTNVVDLIITQIEPVYPNAICVNGGESYNLPVQVTIKNQGNKAAPSGFPIVFQDEVTEATTSIWMNALVIQSNQGLLGGQSKVFSATINVPGIEQLPIRAIVNQGENAIAESRTDNNISQIINLDTDSLPPCGSPEPPDMVITGITAEYEQAPCVEPPPVIGSLIGVRRSRQIVAAQVQQGIDYDLPITVTVSNQGDTNAAAGVQVTVELKVNGGQWAEQAKKVTTTPLGHGDSETLTFTVRVNSAFTMNIRAIVNGDGGLGESDTGNNISDVLPVDTSKLPPCLPDLTIRITDVRTNCDQGITGCTLGLDYTVTNNGQFPTASFIVGFGLTRQDIELSAFTEPLPGLASGESRSVTLPKTHFVPIDCTTLGCTITATVDSQFDIVEFNENNNTDTWSGSIATPEPGSLADLTISITRVSAICSDGCSLTFDYVVRNDSSATVTDSFDIRYAVDNGEPVFVTLDGLASLGSFSDTVTVPADDSCVNPGCTITMTVDSGKVVQESNEFNNTASRSTAPQPDLTVTIKAADAVCDAGTGQCVFTINYTVSNLSIVSTSTGFNIGFAVNDDFTTSFSQGMDSLAAGVSREATITKPGPGPNNMCVVAICKITAIVDVDNTISEANENNNTNDWTGRIVTPEPNTVPDLAVDISNVSASCSEGCFVSFDYTINNFGDPAVTEPFDVVFLVGNEAPVITTFEGLDSMSSFSDSMSIPADDSCVNPGCTITITVDAGKVIDETTEINNTATAFTGPQPDLTVTITQATADCNGGCSVTFDYDVTNNSDVDVTQAFNVEDNMGSDTVILNGLAAHTTVSRTVATPADDSCVNPGCTVQVIVDTTDVIDESNEFNNDAIAFTGSTITPDPEPLPDLTVSVGNVVGNNCDPDTNSCTVMFMLTMTNIGIVDAGAFDIDFQGTTETSGSIAVDKLAAGESQTLTASATSSGNCFEPNCQMTVNIDSNMAVVESNETNNTDSRTFGG